MSWIMHRWELDGSLYNASVNDRVIATMRGARDNGACLAFELSTSWVSGLIERVVMSCVLKDNTAGAHYASAITRIVGTDPTKDIFNA